MKLTRWMGVLVVGFGVSAVTAWAASKPKGPVLSVSTHAASRHSTFERMPAVKTAKDATPKKHFWDRK